MKCKCRDEMKIEDYYFELRFNYMSCSGKLHLYDRQDGVQHIPGRPLRFRAEVPFSLPQMTKYDEDLTPKDLEDISSILRKNLCEAFRKIRKRKKFDFIAYRLGSGDYNLSQNFDSIKQIHGYYYIPNR